MEYRNVVRFSVLVVVVVIYCEFKSRGREYNGLGLSVGNGTKRRKWKEGVGGGNYFSI